MYSRTQDRCCLFEHSRRYKLCAVCREKPGTEVTSIGSRSIAGRKYGVGVDVIHKIVRIST